ncbi:hypothetical protein [Bacillus haynesii]|uniref:hypothetical protein n=1 Tax=Bacillus haynesii TaxID=1925021 RepID=UPI00228061C2|nr:hypothetical protein [Bacillus haynesii]MCY7861594.1 hypothetical protein [Bacillus haynesii]MCY9153916.1 hypothetical protein [Bacillus haynesii]
MAGRKTKEATRKITKIEPFTRYIDYHLNPPTLNKLNGEYVQSQIKNLKRQFDALQSSLKTREDKQKHLLEVLDRKENSPRGTYLRMMNKEHRTKEDLEKFYIATTEIEDIYNALPRLEREIRDTKRKLSILFPDHIVEIIENEFKGEV